MVQPRDPVGSRRPLAGTLETTPPEMLTPQAVAERLGTSVRFVRRLIAERRITFFKVGRHVRISSTDLASYLAAGRVERYR
jgi:excisionase family DNA binding protein